MVTVSTVVKRLVESKPLVYEAIARGIASNAQVAEMLKPAIERELGETVNEPAVVMALRRFSERIDYTENQQISASFNRGILMKTGLCDVTYKITESLMSKMVEISKIVNRSKWDTYNLSLGNSEATFVFSQKYLKKALSLLKKEKQINLIKGAASLTVTLSKDFVHSPGVLSKVTRKLYWEGINVIENMSTMTELIFIVSERDAVKTYVAIEELVVN